MFLESEVNWVLVLAGLAAVSTLVAVLALALAVTQRGRHVSPSDQLDLVQKVAEAADKRLVQTLNAIPVALVETDKQGRFVFANRAAHQLLGRRDAELLGLRFHSATWGITYPDGRPVPPDLMPSAQALRGQAVKGFQHVMANPATRRKMLVSVTALPIEDEFGSVIGSTAAIVETGSLTTPEGVSEARGTDKADLTRRVFDAAASALVVVSVEGTVREANPAALERLGRAQDVIGADFADHFLAEDERVEARQALRTALGGPAGQAPTILTRAASGSDFSWRILPLVGAAGHIDALLLAGEMMQEVSPAREPVRPSLTPVAEASGPDETESLRRDRDAARAETRAALAEIDGIRVQARAESEAGRRLEDVGRLTGGVAHDFSALLSVMNSALAMLLQQADDPARVRRLGEAALTAGRRGEALSRRLSALSHSADEEIRPLDGGVLLRAMEGRLRNLAGPGVDLMIEGPSVPVLVRLDPVGFEGAVQALIVNAVEAAGPGGSIAVRLEATAEGARLTVRDNGPGMDADTADRAREPFFTTKGGAAGLGLAQVYAFARQSGGTLSIDSAPGEGAEVAVTLPAAA